MCSKKDGAFNREAKKQLQKKNLFSILISFSDSVSNPKLETAHSKMEQGAAVRQLKIPL